MKTRRNYAINILLIIAIIGLIITYINNDINPTQRELEGWFGREIKMPENMYLSTYNDNRCVDFKEIKKEYTILHYVDTIGCVSCKLHLNLWKQFVDELDSITPNKVKCIICFYPKWKQLLFKNLKLNNYSEYVYIDEKDSLNLLNKFPENENYRTFLLDNENKVIGIGNPIHNPGIRNLYIDMIQGNNTKGKTYNKITEVEIEQPIIRIDNFHWKEVKTIKNKIRNIGENPLVIEGISTSCDCTTVSYKEKKIEPNEELTFEISYKAEKPETFYRTISIFCNVANSPIELIIEGKAIE